ncbi:MAG: M48 family metalloprotease [Spirochaetes bacterium]|nr:M48 family metalloprotease [Spirochaetota bacterium]
MKTKAKIVFLLAAPIFLWSCQSPAQIAENAVPEGLLLLPLPPPPLASVLTPAETGEGGQPPAPGVAVFTPMQEYYIGRAVAANILALYSLWEADPVLTLYLNKICMAIVINSPKPEPFNGYRVAVLDSQRAASFSTPGGHIFLTRGLLAAAGSEDALAALIAREIAHIHLRHGMAALRAVNAVGSAGEAAGLITAALLEAGFSQEQEASADSLALRLMAAAGYSPTGLLEALSLTAPQPQRLDDISRSIGVSASGGAAGYRQARFNSILGNF